MHPKSIIEVSVEYAKACLKVARRDKHLKGLENFMTRSNPKYNAARSMFKYVFGELRGAMKGTHSNMNLAKELYENQLSQIS